MSNTMRIGAGERTQFYHVENKTNTGRDEVGDTTEPEWTKYVEIWAKEDGNLAGQEHQVAAKQVAEATHRLTFPYVAGLGHDMRFRQPATGRVLGIVHIKNDFGENIQHVVWAKEGLGA